MTQTHPDRQAKILYALKKLDVNYQRCAKCNAFEGNPSDLHAVTQVSASINVITDEETVKEQNESISMTVYGGRQPTVRFALVVCKKCGFAAQYDLDILEQHI